MELFVGSFIIFVLTAFALGIGLLFRGRPMHAGCSGLPGEKGGKSEVLCGGACGRKR